MDPSQNAQRDLSRGLPRLARAYSNVMREPWESLTRFSIPSPGYRPDTMRAPSSTLPSNGFEDVVIP